MREVDRTRLIQANRSKVCRRVICRLAIVLCLLSGVVGFMLSERNSRVSSARPNEAGHGEQAGLGKLIPHVSVVGPVPSDRAGDGLWRLSEKSGRKSSRAAGDAGAEAGPKFYRALSLNEAAQRKLLSRAPMEFTNAASHTQVVMTLPMPDGTFARFRIEESPVMAGELAARFPDIRTYRGHGLDDPTATTRLDMTPAGFHAIVLSSKGTVIVEPVRQANRDPHRQYISYDISQKQRDAPNEAGSFSCLLLGAEQAAAQVQSKQLSRTGDANIGVVSGATLRTYRLALAATAEFTQTFGGGTVSGALSAMTTMINAVNAIYERDLGIHLALVANETSIIFTNSATDGYTSDNATLLGDQNQVVLGQRIGSANYDLGMVMDGRVFGLQPGFVFQGAAYYQSTCTAANKGKAVTILRSTEPSSIAATYVVAHELAHLLGAIHTFNSTLDDCGPSRFENWAYEPGGGSTIMGYRGGVLPNGTFQPLCAADELFSTDTYFHAASIEQINTYTNFGTGSFCPVETSTGNSPPNIDAGADYIRFQLIRHSRSRRAAATRTETLSAIAGKNMI